jgi:hypothetical protein
VLEPQKTLEIPISNLLPFLLFSIGVILSAIILYWYQKKETELSKEQFWHLRVFFVHRGGSKVEKGSTVKKTLTVKPIEIYVPPSAISGDAISPTSASVITGGTEVKTEKELTIANIPETIIIAKSERVYSIMEEIVKEARNAFG